MMKLIMLGVALALLLLLLVGVMVGGGMQLMLMLVLVHLVLHCALPSSIPALAATAWPPALVMPVAFDVN